MTHLNWKLAAGILIGLVVVIALVLQLTTSVRPFEPPEGRQLSDWGSVDLEVAQELQSILDKDVNLIRVPGLQAYVRTPDGKTWSGTSGTTDLARKNLMRRDHVLRVGSVTKSFTAVLMLLKSIIPSTYWQPDELVERIVEDEPQFTLGSRTIKAKKRLATRCTVAVRGMH